MAKNLLVKVMPEDIPKNIASLGDQSDFFGDILAAILGIRINKSSRSVLTLLAIKITLGLPNFSR